MIIFEYKHGEGKTKLYRIWSSMRDRCNNPRCKDYKYYGAKGVRVSSDWDDFLSFKKWSLDNGYRENAGLTIDRINVNGNYEPENCRWVDRKTQANNMTSNHLITYNGDTHTISEWSEITGIPFGVLQARICSYHWDIERALTSSVGEHNLYYDVNGERKSLKDIAVEFGINYHTLYNRLFIYGYDFDKAIGKSA